MMRIYGSYAISGRLAALLQEDASITLTELRLQQLLNAKA